MVVEARKALNPALSVTARESPADSDDDQPSAEGPARGNFGLPALADHAVVDHVPVGEASSNAPAPEDRMTRMESSLIGLTAKLGTLTEAVVALVHKGAQPLNGAPGTGNTAETTQGIPKPQEARRDVTAADDPTRGHLIATAGSASFWERDVITPADNGGRTGITGAPQQQGLLSTMSTAAASSPKEALLGKGVASHNVPRISLVSPRLRGEILAGKDINLARLLIPDQDEYNQREILLSDGAAIPVKPRTDHRLLKNLTLNEFIKAFTMYKDVMVEGYPHRAGELTLYMNEIVDMATDFGGATFYQYHKQFSARSAALLLNHHIKLDWSIRDNDLYCKLFAGHRANSCSLCSSMAHSTGFCPLSMFQGNQTNSYKGQSVKRSFNETNTTYNQNSFSPKKPKYESLSSGQEICLNFNTKGCYKGPNCLHAHVCLSCKSEHHNRTECVHGQASRPHAAHTGVGSHTKSDGQFPRKVTNGSNKFEKIKKQ